MKKRDQNSMKDKRNEETADQSRETGRSGGAERANV